MSGEGDDYIAFRDSVIVALADDQEPPGLGDLELTDLCKRHRIAFYDTWIMTVGADMESLGWGRDRSTLKQRRFLINGAGLARAAEVRRARKPKSLVQHVQGANWAMWSVVIAAAALVAYLTIEVLKN